MATSVGNLVVNVSADSAAFTSNMKSIVENTKQTATQVQRGVHLMQEAFEALAIAELAEHIYEAGERAVEFGAKFGEAAKQVGFGTKAYQELSFAAAHTGVTQESLDTGLAKFTKTLGLAEAGSGKAAFALKEVGIAQADLRDKTPEDILRKVSDALAKIEDPAHRARIETELFGKAGQKLDPLLSEGTKALDDFAKAASDLGVVLTDEEIERLHKLEVRSKELSNVLTTNFAAAIGDNADAIVRLGNAASGAVAGVLRLVSQAVGLRRITEYEGALTMMGASGATATAAGDPIKYAARLRANLAALEADQTPGQRRGFEASGFNSSIEAARSRLAAFLNSPDYKEAVEAGLVHGKPGAITDFSDDLAGKKRTPRTRKTRVKAAVDPFADTLSNNADFLNGTVDDFLKDRDKREKAATAAYDRLGKFLGIDPISTDGIFAGRTILGETNEQFDARMQQRDEELKVLEEKQKKYDEIGTQFAANVTTALESAIIGGKSLGEVFGGLFKTIEQLVIRLAIIEPIAKGISGAFSGGGGIVSSIGLLLGFASGGDPPVGQPYLVGENGPELRVDKSQGTIIPNHVLKGLGGGGGVSINVDARGALDPAAVGLAIRSAVAASEARLLGVAAATQRQKIAAGRG